MDRQRDRHCVGGALGRMLSSDDPAALGVTPAVIGGVMQTLLAENATNRFLMKSYLEGAGALVRYASSGPEATRRLRALEAELGATRCVAAALTAHAGPDAAEAAGMDAFLTKPLIKSDVLGFMASLNLEPVPGATRDTGGSRA